VEIQEFFETYKRLEPHKWVKVREWKDATAAQEVVKLAMKRYLELGVTQRAQQQMSRQMAVRYSQTLLSYLIQVCAVLTQICHKTYYFPTPSVICRSRSKL
jgi:hypothetical protein